ncbi:hypothetical protein FZC83_07205 [Rossellomorea marisflavi]|uniref:Uncharacterized protein n=1 Tax=Rossellomorea marisflavi TaxID=189381 RepID=A0A5D4RTY2_9BACI|nr:SIR2 family protein [Rossellomorea marisflavi]TYS54727.1 hypothetical protein FZC83_07205 [Rossellomorea marisflavi]
MDAENKLNILRESLVEKNATFLFGAGASAPYFSSLGNFERILSHESISEHGKTLIKILFYDLCIKDNMYVANYMNGKCYCHEKKDLMLSIINEYSRFIYNSIEHLKVRNSRISPKRINLITTNYDLFIESAIDNILTSNPRIFFNDGTNGYGTRILSSDNFNKTLLYTGIFDNYSNEMPSVNLIKCHGSVNWKENKDNNGRSKIQILIEKNSLQTINEGLETYLDELKSYLKRGEFSQVNSYKDMISLLNREINEDLIIKINCMGEDLHTLMPIALASSIESLQIVLPTKKKFQTTLIEEHYFNMLRLVSYELEKSQSILVVFGFSFNDEHIRDIIQRSLNNPNLLVFIFCFNDRAKEEIISQFNFSFTNKPVNIIFIEPKDFLLKKIPVNEYSEEDYNSSSYTTIENKDSILLYSKEVSKLSNDNNIETPIINFSAFNSILERNITNKYISNKIAKSGDGYE